MKSALQITRHISCGQRYWKPEFSAEDNEQAYGDLTSPQGLGHNLLVQASSREADSQTLAEELKAVLKNYDHKYLNEDHPQFKNRTPTPELLAQQIFMELEESGVGCLSVRVYEGEGAWGAYDPVNGHAFAKEYKINCVHRHHNPDLSEAENAQLYGKCSRVHGHEYRFEVQLSGALDDQWDIVFPRGILDQRVQSEIIDCYDKKFLNDHVGNTSGEIICKYFFDKLLPFFQDSVSLQLNLRETRKNSFYFRG